MAGGENKTLALRLPVSMIRDLDEYRARIGATLPGGMTMSRNHAIRVLVALGLEHVEKRREKDR